MTNTNPGTSIIAFAAGAALGAATALLFAPQSGREIRSKITHSKDKLSEAAQDTMQKASDSAEKSIDKAADKGKQLLGKAHDTASQAVKKSTN